MSFKLRPYQSKAVDDVEAAFEQVRRVCLMAPTGAGKTVIFSHVARMAAAAGARTAILVHRDNLLEQAAAKLRETGVRHSLITPGHSHFGNAVSVASVQTLVRRLDRYEFDFLIPDEAHHATSPTYRKIFDRWPNAHILGVTATPMRPDGTGLDTVFDRLALGPSIGELIRDGYLVEPVAYGAPRKVDLGGVHSRAGDYDLRELSEIMDRTTVTGDAVEHYNALCPRKAALAFCVTVKHAEDVAAQFCEAGFKFASVDGSMDRREVRRRLAALAEGSLHGIASCDLVSEGTDVPRVQAIIGLRPTKSLVVNLQQVGRGLRPDYLKGPDLSTREGRVEAIARSEKPRAIVIDHAGNTFRFGCADDDREWTLEGRKKGSRGGGVDAAPPIRQCPKCYATHKPLPTCPACGHVYAVEAGPEVEAGTLQEIDKDALRRARAREVSQARTYDQLKELGRKRGYRPEWAWRIWIERGGNPVMAG